MSPRRIVIVGAGPAGLATARADREHGGMAELIMLGRETLVPYRRPPLTKEFLRGRVLAGEDAQWQDVPGFWSTIGRHTIKYAAWGDGHEESRLEEQPDGAFTIWYSHHGKLVGALTHDRDEDYEHARQLIAAGDSPP